MSDFAKQLAANYNKPKSQIAFENLQKIDKNFTHDNLFALAFMATNEGIPEEDREIFKQMLQIKLDENLATLIKVNEQMN
jgi:hypothetical protein